MGTGRSSEATVLAWRGIERRLEGERRSEVDHMLDCMLVTHWHVIPKVTYEHVTLLEL